MLGKGFEISWQIFNPKNQFIVIKQKVAKSILISCRLNGIKVCTDKFFCSFRCLQWSKVELSEDIRFGIYISRFVKIINVLVCNLRCLWPGRANHHTGCNLLAVFKKSLVNQKIQVIFHTYCNTFFLANKLSFYSFHTV